MNEKEAIKYLHSKGYSAVLPNYKIYLFRYKRPSGRDWEIGIRKKLPFLLIHDLEYCEIDIRKLKWTKQRKQSPPEEVGE